MRSLFRCLPDADFFHRHRARIGGFVAGALGTLMLALYFSVLYSGHGAFADPPRPETVVYPNF